MADILLLEFPQGSHWKAAITADCDILVYYMARNILVLKPLLEGSRKRNQVF